MKKLITIIIAAACVCFAELNPTHYFEGKWYFCYEYQIKPEKLPKCTEYNTDIVCADYDGKGNEIHIRYNDSTEIWSEYDLKGNVIHRWNRVGVEGWYEYDLKGNEIHRRLIAKDYAYEAWYEYEYDSKGNMIHRKFHSSDGNDDGSGEEWHEHDSKGNIIHSKFRINDDSGEVWYKWFFDKKNNKEYKCDVDKDGNPEF